MLQKARGILREAGIRLTGRSSAQTYRAAQIESCSMNKALAVMAVLGIAAVTVYIAIPPFLEVMIGWDCPLSDPDEACQTRMRAVGHVQSKRGNLERAKYWYGRVAEQGNPIAMFHLAWVHEELALGDGEAMPGQEARSNLELAMAWYQRSADYGFAPSMNNIGQMYQSGRAGRQDHDTALGWHIAAARAGNPVGRLNVAMTYAAGHGVARDPLEAADWTTWTPNADHAADLLEPTLARTRLFGSPLPAEDRERLRAGAKAGAPVQMTITMRPLAADPSLPAFQEAADDPPNRRP